VAATTNTSEAATRSGCGCGDDDETHELEGLLNHTRVRKHPHTLSRTRVQRVERRGASRRWRASRREQREGEQQTTRRRRERQEGVMRWR